MQKKFLSWAILLLVSSDLHAQTNGSPVQTPLPAAPSNDAQIKGKLAALDSKVSSLPTSPPAEHYKKTILQLAMERSQACLDASLPDEAAALIGDVEKTLGAPAETLTTPSSRTNTISALVPPRVVQNNPYITRMVAGAKEELLKSQKPFATNTPAVNTFSGLGGEAGSRSSGDEMQAWLWLFANPASPLKGDPKVLERYLRLATAYADAIDVHGGMSLAGSSNSIEATKNTPLVGAQGSKGNENAPLAGQGIFDDFAIAPASTK